MEKIIIIYNSHDKESRDFISANPSVKAIDWYSRSSDLMEYFSKELPHIGRFPSVVDTEEKLSISKPSTMEEAIEKISAVKNKNRSGKLKQKRDDLILATKHIQDRHRDEIDDEATTTITPAKYKKWLKYWKQLRNMDTSNPDTVEWPVEPS
jgi:hypothetical protein